MEEIRDNWTGHNRKPYGDGKINREKKREDCGIFVGNVVVGSYRRHSIRLEKSCGCDGKDGEARDILTRGESGREAENMKRSFPKRVKRHSKNNRDCCKANQYQVRRSCF